MKNRAFSKLLEQLKILTPFQKEKLQSSLDHHNAMDTISDVIDTAQSCPYCSSQSHQKWGMRSGLQRYRCNTCERTYALTGTPLARLRLKAWMRQFNGVATKYLESYLGWRRLLEREKVLTAERLLGIMSKRGMVCQPLMLT